MSTRLTKAFLIEQIAAADKRAAQYGAPDFMRAQTFLAVLCGRLDYYFPEVSAALAKGAGIAGSGDTK